MLKTYFPHETIRPGQEGFITDLSAALLEGKHFVSHAPTGIGKTAASLAPAIEYAMDKGKKVLFLTSRQSQHRIAIETIRDIQAKVGEGNINVIDLIGKQGMCIHKALSQAHPGEFLHGCQQATRKDSKNPCRFYRTADDAEVQSLVGRAKHVDEVINVGKNLEICPYVLANAFAAKCKVIVADYNHVFSETSEMSMEKWETTLANCIVIVDEAHNLGDRIRNNHSHSLNDFDFSVIISECRDVNQYEAVATMKELQDHLKNLVRGAIATGNFEESWMNDAKTRLTRLTVDDIPLNLVADVKDQLGAVQAMISKAKGAPSVNIDVMLRAIADYRRFKDAALRYIEHKDGKKWSLNIRLLAPGVVSGPTFANIGNAILMSGTMHPVEAVESVLDLETERTSTHVYASPFPPENRPTVIYKGISTKFTARSPALWSRLADIARTELRKTAGGNAAIFAPSYNIMREMLGALELGLVGKNIIVENRGMTKEERDHVLADMRHSKDEASGAVLFGVLGGSFSEGIDFKDNLLDAIIIVGLPLAPPSLEIQEAIEYYDRHYEKKGQLFAYTIPAMNKVMQAMGRGVRSSTDKCRVILLDERYAWSTYKNLLPPDAVIEYKHNQGQAKTGTMTAHGYVPG